jgi:YggT family protein
MFVIANFVEAVVKILDLALTVYMWIVVAAALVSWVNPDPYNPIVRFLYRSTEPVLRPIRRRLGALGGIDFSPMIVILLIIFIKSFVIKSLAELAFRMR